MPGSITGFFPWLMLLAVILIYAAISRKQYKTVKQIKNIIDNNFNSLHNKYKVPQNAIQTYKCKGHPQIDCYGIMSSASFFYLWADDFNLYMLCSNKMNVDKYKTVYEIPIQRIISFSLKHDIEHGTNISREGKIDKSQTVLEFMYNGAARFMFFDSSVYNYLLHTIPGKEISINS